MTYRRLSICAALLGVAALGVAGCSGGHSKASSSATPPNSAASTSASASASASSVSTAAANPAPAATSALVPADVPAGTATDFCSAYTEFKTAAQAGTPQAVGAGFRAAAADMRKYAPAEIKAGAAMYADMLDEIGKQIAAGGAKPETIGSGQSAERRQALADSILWVAKNCH